MLYSEGLEPFIEFLDQNLTLVMGGRLRSCHNGKGNFNTSMMHTMYITTRRNIDCGMSIVQLGLALCK